MIEIDLVRSASDAILDSSAVAEKGGPLFGCLSVWPWPVSRYISTQTYRRRFGLEATTARSNVGRSGSAGWRCRVNTQTRSDPSRQDAASYASPTRMRREYLLFFFLARLPRETIGERVFVRRKDARRLPRDDQADQSFEQLLDRLFSRSI